MIFLEDFAALKPGGFEALKADCVRLSDGSLLALPGITYENVDGNHEFAFGKHLKLPSLRWSTDFRCRLWRLQIVIPPRF